MKSPRGFVSAIFLSMLLSLKLQATIATALSSFEGIEEPLVRYDSTAGTFVRDDFVNITDFGGGIFRMRLRYESAQWDADRDTRNTDRQRAEVKGLGVHQKTGETFEYSTTWRTNPEFTGAFRFCHVFQLKSTNGDSGAPLVTLSIDEDRKYASIRYWSGHAKEATVARKFPWKPNVWQTVRIRVKTSVDDDGEVLASVDGDPFQGARAVAVYRTGATDYRPKWGFYRGVKAGLRLGEDYVEHRDISSGKFGAPPVTRSPSLERVARERLAESPTNAVGWLLSQPVSPARDELAAILVTEWSYREPAAAMNLSDKLTPAESREQAKQRVFNRWTDQDPDAVLRWTATQKPTSEVDQLLWYFATDTTLRYVARDKALAAAKLINDSELRAQALDHVILIWARSDPAAAAHYVRTCEKLSGAQKSAILAKIDRRSDAKALTNADYNPRP